jgi:c-di-GMP-binding flagellar brake protein YcgR
VEAQGKNRREYFRISFAELFGKMQIVEVSGRAITTAPKNVRIFDLGGGGLSITMEEDLPIRRGIAAVFEFTVAQFHFTFRGAFTRKLDDIKSYQYGIRFLDVDEKQRDMLVGVLGRLQVDRNTKAGS